MSTAAITYDKIESYAYENIFAYIDNRSNVKDPRNPSGIRGRDFVYSSDPFIKAVNFSDFPFIVVEFPIITYSEPSADSKKKFAEWEQRIIVRAARTNITVYFEDVGRSDMLNIGDDLNELFNSDAKRKEFEALNIINIQLRKVAVDTLAVSQKEIYEAEYALTFRTRLATSA